MFSAGELIEALQSRGGRRFPLHADRPFGEFPPTWRTWFLSMRERAGAVVGAPMAEIVALLAARPPAPRPKASPPLTRSQAWRHLMRQQWERAPGDQRWTRRFAAVFSALLHIVFAGLLFWIGMIQLGDAPPEVAKEGEATLIEFIGEGTPSTDTGGAPATGEQAAAPAAASAASASAPETNTEDTPAVAAATPPVAAAPSETAPAPPGEAAPPPAAEQPLTVTHTPTPDSDFTLPPPTPPVLSPTLPQLQPQVPKVAARPTDVETFEARTPVPVPDRPVPVLAVQPTVPRLRTRVVEVETQRDTTPIAAREAPALPTTAPQLRMPTLRTAPREVQLRVPPAQTSAPTPTPAASGQATASTPVRTTGQAPLPSTTAGGTPRPATGAGRPVANAPGGVGPSPSPRPGAAPAQVRSDDWGASNRNAPGNATAGRSTGLLNGDGSARLPAGNGRDVGGGLPPGTVIEDFEKIDRMGTWLKRPPLDYTPTRFDRFWMPRENLLEEWVRRGVRTVAIPIPGTTKRIMCAVSLLQAGGGCTIEDPNLQDQEAIARPPPDVPFKPALQEAKDSLARPAPPPAAAPPGTP